MSICLIIWIDADDAAPLIGQLVEDGVLASPLPLETLAADRPLDWVVAYAPVSAVHLVSAELPPLPQLQRNAVAREQLAPAFAGPVHLASSALNAGACRVAWVDPVRLAAWQTRMREAGYEPDAIIPAAFLVDEGDVPCRATLCGEEVWALAEGTIPADMGSDSEKPDRALNPASLAQRAAALADAPPLSLLTGAFSPRSASSFAAQKGKVFALVAAIAAVTALMPAAQAWRANHDAAALEAEAQSLAKASFAQSPNPVASLGEAVSARQSGGAGFLPTLQAVSAVVEATPGAELSSLAFAPDGWMSVSVRTSNAGEFAQMVQKLEAAGFRVALGAIVAEQGRQSASLRVRG